MTPVEPWKAKAFFDVAFQVPSQCSDVGRLPQQEDERNRGSKDSWEEALCLNQDLCCPHGGRKTDLQLNEQDRSWEKKSSSLQLTEPGCSYTLNIVEEGVPGVP